MTKKFGPFITIVLAIVLLALPVGAVGIRFFAGPAGSDHLGLVQGDGVSLGITSAGVISIASVSAAVLPDTGTQYQMLQSGGGAADPAYSTATWPATTAVNQLLYSSGANTVAGLTTGNSGILVTSGAGVPSIGTDIPTAVTIGSAYVYRVGGTDVALADGGLSASLTASNGGIFYSTATAGAILAGTATANQVLLSGATGAPAWSTATYPATAAGTGTILRADGTNWVATTATYPTTTSANQLLYSSAANTIAGLATASSAVVVTDANGAPSEATDIPTAVTIGGAYVYRASGTDVALLDGGTNAGLTAANGGVVYSTATALAIGAAGNAGQLLSSAGAAAPVWTTATYPATAAGTGTILRADGTNWAASTATYPGTTSANQLLYSSAANTVSGLATASNGVLLTDVDGVPSIGTTIPTGVQDNITRVGTVVSGAWQSSTKVGLAYGGTNADLSGTGGSGQVLKQDTLGGTITVGTISGASITGAALTEADDTNVTLTLAGSASTAVLGATSITAGWTGQLAAPRGGTGLSTFGGVNTLLYTTAADTLTSVATAANAVVVTGATGVPSEATDLPTAVTIGTAYIYRVGGTDVALADGGLNASLAASNGGIFYSTDTAGAVLAGTATAGQMLRSGASSAPSWSTATYPATTGANQLLYSSAANVVGGVATASSAVLVTDASGVPSEATDIPTAVTIGGAYVYRASGTDVALLDGGLNASLTASNGGIFYSTATAGAILAGTATANQLLMSGSSTTPAWSTATYPATVTANRLLYASGANTVADLASANSGVLVTSGAGVPSIATDIPTAVTIGGAYVYRASGTDVPLLDGGSNASLTAANGGIVYSTATAMAITSAGSSGQILSSGGAGAPVWSTATYPTTAGSAGTILRADGTNWVATTATYPNTTTENQILYSAAPNQVSGIATASSAVLVTGAAGVPNFATDLPTAVTIGSAYVYRASGTDVAMADGGTNASLTANTGGIVYSGASALAVLAGTATANQVLLSGSTAAPAWSTATYPATTVENQILYSSATNTIAGIATASSAVLVTGAGAVPNLATDLPTAITIGSAYIYRAAGTDVALADGGLNASLTASNGGIFYSTATAGAILAGTATANQLLMSGSSAAPAWSTATYPATTVENQLLYSSATNQVSGIATSSNTVLITGGAGVPMWNATLPTAVQGNITQTGTITTGTWNAGAVTSSGNIISSSGYLAAGVASPGAPLEVATSNAVDYGFLEVANDAAQPYFYFRKARGTVASKTDVAQNDLTRLHAMFYAGGGYRSAAAIEFAVDGATVGAGDMPGRLTFWTTPDGSAGALERMRINNAGEVLINGSSAYGRLGQLFEANNATTYGGAALSGWVNADNEVLLDFNKSRGGAVGTHGVVVNGDTLGTITFRGSDGNAFRGGAAIAAVVDGAVTGGGAADMPGGLVFYTTPDVSATLTERMRINNAGTVTPGADNAQSLGTASLRWSDLRSVLINGSDYGLANGWRMVESDVFRGYGKGFALVAGDWRGKPAIWEHREQVSRIKPTFAVTEKDIEWNNRKLNREIDALQRRVEQLEKRLADQKSGKTSFRWPWERAS